ncbi:7301_t:CDS:2 [Funneliformis mosseae]|uniref:tRNA (adenine(58)-N(1))-methyltransferase catalytic subunit TRM61 n=1 Tax=Funneliformis mosseae TaxID=27381 RepID=A0A9N9DM10_FUNMO|nr:7301_t:CDS:2 [Funneliformis mosseae]
MWRNFKKLNLKLHQNIQFLYSRRTICDKAVINEINEKFDRTKFVEGDTVILRDTAKKIKGSRKSLIGPLTKGAKTENFCGIINHDSIIGISIRSVIKTNKGIVSDKGNSVALLDLHPYSRILEVGTGNGSLTLYLARAIYPTGHIQTIDCNAENIRKSQKNVKQYFRGIYYDNITFNIGTCSDIFNSLSESADGIVLDLPEPWLELPSIIPKLKLDRFIICYLPNMTQVLELIKFIRVKKFKLATEQVLEILWRPWEVRSTVIRSKMDENISFSIDNLVMENRIPEKALAYVCRPTCDNTTGHTAFLVQLKKIEDDM